MLTAGHSNRSLEGLIELLGVAGVRYLVDIRSYPGSRRLPWFNREALARGAGEDGIEYLWEGRALGGRRPRKAEDPERHPALPDDGLRAFARHMEGERFREATDRVLALPPEATVLLCAEADAARCHRSLVADFLEAVRERPVSHIMGDGRLQRHTIHPGARVVGGLLRYDRSGGQASLGLV
mgnify:CR=1 FL=1